ncbi:OmpP1/FadL family transporter [Vitiosangium sp. GDMCC 1.1324]|uniref:OmpP1/FadL family transporter n=1 Tax=Vitiosangium sp. (strain GDMCC 1.1324) TaxID=2138576 RepID=UPI00130DA3BA|nr:outer membrane protein transport protein [Vitiosangium sp. GDMCC 1.1324]
MKTSRFLFLLTALVFPLLASASGLYVGDRGVRSLGRGGAFVAGADDLGALWYNPAGLVDAGSSVLLDGSWVRFSTDFTRRVLVTNSAGATQTSELPSVSGSSEFLPIPTIAGSWVFGERKQLVVAAGVLAPQMAVMSYPLTLDDGSPAPSRYSLVSLEGSLLVIPGVSAAYRPFDFLQLGAGVNVLTGNFVTRTVFNTSPPERLLSAPEDPSYDALAELKATGLLAPSASFGAIVSPAKWLRVGVSGQLGYTLDAPATVRVRLPSAAVFDQARQEGDSARLKLKLPAILRAGIEVRPLEALRVELGYARELWSSHESIDIVAEDVRIYDVSGIPSPFTVPTISIPRRFKDSQSFRLGGEYSLSVGSSFAVEVRAGLSYEQSAIPAAYLAPLTVDTDKVTGSVGLGLRLGQRLRLDAVYSQAFGGQREVSPSEAAVPRINPMADEDAPVSPVNGGSYQVRTSILGFGFRYQL